MSYGQSSVTLAKDKPLPPTAPTLRPPKASEPATGRPAFQEELRSIASRLRGELATLFAVLPEPVESGADLKRQLGLGNTASWRFYSFVSAADPLAAVGQLPGRIAMGRLIDAARRRGVEDGPLSRVMDAFGRFESFAKEHADDRATLDVLASGLSSSDGAGAADDLRWRREALRINSHLWGVRTRTTVTCMVCHGGARPGPTDAVLLRGYVGLHALRGDLPLRILSNAGAYSSSDPEPAQKPLRAPNETYVLHAFSTDPLPPLEQSKGAMGMTETSLRFTEVGRTAAIEVFTARVWSDAYGGAPQAWYGASAGVSVPSDVFLLDLLIPRGWTDTGSVRASTHGSVSMYESIVPRVPEFELPVRDPGVYLGTDLRGIETPDVPRYLDMLRSVLAEQRWDGATFDIYRCRVRYPIMHSLIHMRATATAG